MATKQEQAVQSKRDLIDAAAAEFRLSGYAGAGVDAIAKRAGLTSGAFYQQFGSKAEIFAIVVAEGFNEFVQAVRQRRAKATDDWTYAFTEFYFSRTRREAIATGCVLPSLAEEIVRADDNAKQAFSQGIESLVQEFSGDLQSLPDEAARSRVLAALATMAGGVTLARAAHSEALADQIAAAASQSVLQLLTKSPPLG